MKRTLFQLVIQNCDEAIAFYTDAFQASLLRMHRDPDTGAVFHAEIDAFGQCIAFTESVDSAVIGNTMMFCFELGEGSEDLIRHAYSVLKEDADINHPLGPSSWSPMMMGLVDKYGTNWCLFV